MDKVTESKVPVTINGVSGEIVFNGPDLNDLDEDCIVSTTGDLTPVMLEKYFLDNARPFPYDDPTMYEGLPPYSVLNLLAIFGLEFVWPPEIIIPERTELQDLMQEIN